MRFKPKMILIFSGIVLASIVSLSVIILWQNQAVLLDKTFQVCRTLGSNISNLATEELLVNQTYDATGTAMAHLRGSEIEGLLDSYVVNLEGQKVAQLREGAGSESINQDLRERFFAMKQLEFSETKSEKLDRTVLQFVYPIFIKQFKGPELRVGTAVFEFDKNVVYQPIAELRNNIIMVSVILLALALLAGLVTAFTIARPLQLLSEGASIIGEGNLDHRIQVSNRDEMGELADAFNLMTDRVQDFTHNLEKKVEERTEQLNQSLEHVSALKTQQDGDYFLTSLLMEPLQKNNNHSSLVRTEFIVRQKKSFQFRQWNSEIGGDLCITETIPIGGKEYTVFLNTDAMGKSIQGAGGALVLGAVFHSILVRSKIGRHQAKFPETWLKEAFLDLQSIFVSFNGSMYISMVLGLVDEKGVMYFVNAEHPFTVLYRGGRAEFLEDNIALRKLGVPGLEDQFFIRMFELAPGDVVFLGSDGRDDILIQTAEGEELMNEDEHEFLRRVEEGEGKLARIEKRLVETGQLTDDLSLLRVSYGENTKAPARAIRETPEPLQRALEERTSNLVEEESEERLEDLVTFVNQNRDYPHLLRSAGNLFMKYGHYEHALECYLEYNRIDPADDDYLYMISRAYFANGETEKAADYGERLYLRNPDHPRNLQTLAEVHYDLGTRPRALRMLERLLDQDADNEEAISLYRKTKQELAADTEEEEHIPESELRSLVESANELYGRGRYRQALQGYQKIVALEPNVEWAKFRSANCYFQMGDHKKAIVWYNRTLLQNPKNYHARNNLATVLFREGDHELARRQLEKALEIKADFAAARKNLEQLQLAADTHAKAG